MRMFFGLLLSALAIMLGVALVLRGLLGIVDAMIPDPSPQPLITRADFPVCVTVKPPPLREQKRMSGERADTHPEII